MRVVFSLIFVALLVAAFCGYEIVASTRIERNQLSLVPGMRSPGGADAVTSGATSAGTTSAHGGAATIGAATSTGSGASIEPRTKPKAKIKGRAQRRAGRKAAYRGRGPDARGRSIAQGPGAGAGRSMFTFGFGE